MSKNNNTQDDYTAFDSQWDVIKRGDAKQFAEAKARYLKSVASVKIKTQSIESKPERKKKFRPSLEQTGSQTQIYFELFKDGRRDRSTLDTSTINTIAEAISQMNDTVSERIQPAGYTYLAQLLTHDIVPSTSLLRTRNTSLELNLDSLYFPFCDANRWGSVNDSGEFVLENDETDFYRVKWTPQELRCEDIEIPQSRSNDYHFAVTPDHRNDGNIILSQLTVLFQRVHNYVVGELIKVNENRTRSKDQVYYKKFSEGEEYCKNSITGEAYYNAARQIIILLFQKIVVSDLLKVTLDPDTYDYYFVHHGPSLFETLEGQNDVPKEFTHAVSRYAHSMIRPRYKLRSKEEKVSIHELFRKNLRLCDAEGDRLRISDWSLFFAKGWQNSKGTNKAIDIDLRTPLLPVSEGPINRKVMMDPAKNLATFDIKASSELTTYSEIRKNKKIESFFKNVKNIFPNDLDHMYFDRINYDRVNEELADINKTLSFNNVNAPFLVSMFLEADAMPKEHNRDRLGVVGSIVYAETIRASINNHKNINIFKEKQHLNRELDWAYPVYESLIESLNPINMLQLSKLISLKSQIEEK